MAQIKYGQVDIFPSKRTKKSPKHSLPKNAVVTPEKCGANTAIARKDKKFTELTKRPLPKIVGKPPVEVKIEVPVAVEPIKAEVPVDPPKENWKTKREKQKEQPEAE